MDDEYLGDGVYASKLDAALNRAFTAGGGVEPTKTEECEARFKLRIISRLTVEGSNWTREQALAAAQAEWEGISEDVGENAMWSMEESPEDSADESMSYWENDGDDE